MELSDARVEGLAEVWPPLRFDKDGTYGVRPQVRCSRPLPRRSCSAQFLTQARSSLPAYSCQAEHSGAAPGMCQGD